MAQTVRELMTSNPVTLPTTAKVSGAARPDARARHRGGDRHQPWRQATRSGDRSRHRGPRRGPAARPVDRAARRDLQGRDVATVAPDATMEDAIAQLRGRRVRRLPVVEDGRVVGMISAGDLVTAAEPPSLLAELSRRPANRQGFPPATDGRHWTQSTVVGLAA